MDTESDDSLARVIRETRAINKEQGGAEYEPPRRERQYPSSEDGSDILHESDGEKYWAKHDEIDH